MDDVGLERLDVFEEHPTWYNRQLTEVELIPPNGKPKINAAPV